MIPIRRLIRAILEPTTYIWVDATLVYETPKAILILFDGRKTWIPKAWVVQIKRNGNRSIKIKISDYHWAKKAV